MSGSTDRFAADPMMSPNDIVGMAEAAPSPSGISGGNMGWTCPLCGASNAPSVKKCDCASQGRAESDRSGITRGKLLIEQA